MILDTADPSVVEEFEKAKNHQNAQHGSILIDPRQDLFSTSEDSMDMIMKGTLLLKEMYNQFHFTVKIKNSTI